MFEQVAPLYISFGMTPEQFWEGNPRWAKEYREAFALTRKRQNVQSWLDGRYVMEAVSCSLANAFKKRGAPPTPYMKEPLPLTMEEVEERRIRDAIEAEQRIIANMKRISRQSKEG